MILEKRILILFYEINNKKNENTLNNLFSILDNLKSENSSEHEEETFDDLFSHEHNNYVDEEIEKLKSFSFDYETPAQLISMVDELTKPLENNLAQIDCDDFGEEHISYEDLMIMIENLTEQQQQFVSLKNEHDLKKHEK